MKKNWAAMGMAAVMLASVPGAQAWAQPTAAGEEQQQTEEQQIKGQQSDGTEISTQQLGGSAGEQSYGAGETVTVSDAEGLMHVAAMLNRGSHSPEWNINLEADIDLSGENWPGIGNGFRKYCATFNGNGHTVTLPAGSASLINYAEEATVKDVIVKSTGRITASEHCGAGCVGGVVGHINGGTIKNCGNLASIKGGAAKSGWEHQAYVGGVAGYARGVTIQNCWNGGTVEGNGANYIGGIVGYMLKKNNKEGAVFGCYNFGTITGDNSGGIAGRLDGSWIQNCSNSGTVSGEENVAGIVYHVSNGTVQFNQNTGKISGTGRMPIVGTMEQSMLYHYNYYDGTDWTESYNWGEARTREKLLSGSAENAPMAETWTVKKSFYPYLTAGGDRAKAQAAAAWVTEKDGIAYLNLSTDGTDAWELNGIGLTAGSSCTLTEGAVLTYSCGDYEKNISWEGGEKSVIVMFGFPDEKELGFTVLADGTAVSDEKGIYKAAYGSSVEVSAVSAGGEIKADEKAAASLGLRLNESGLSGTISRKPEDTPVQIMVYAENPAGGSWKAGALKLRVVKALPQVKEVLFNEGRDHSMIYNGSPVKAEVVPEEEQMKLNVSDITVRWYRQNSTERLDAAPADAGSYYASVYYPGNAYYRALDMEQGTSEGIPFIIEGKALTEEMFSGTDWQKRERLDSSVAKKEVLGKDGDKELVQNRDYTVAYSAVDTPGTAEVTITGTGNYTGTIVKHYEIAMGSAPVKLTPGAEKGYTLGGGNPNLRWTLKGQSSVKYHDGITFYVTEEGSYQFESSEQ